MPVEEQQIEEPARHHVRHKCRVCHRYEECRNVRCRRYYKIICYDCFTKTCDELYWEDAKARCSSERLSATMCATFSCEDGDNNFRSCITSLQHLLRERIDNEEWRDDSKCGAVMELVSLVYDLNARLDLLLELTDPRAQDLAAPKTGKRKEAPR